MKRIIRDILIIVVLLSVSLLPEAQQLNVTVTNVGSNKIQFMGTPTGAGFATSPNNTWGDMNLTWRIPKTAAIPASTPPPAPPAKPTATPEVTAENTAFTGGAPKDVFTGGLDLAIFDITTFGGTDDGYWYFQVTGTSGSLQDIAAGGTVLLYEFTVPPTWSCPSCVELLTADVPDLMTLAGISTTSFIHNAGLNTDVLNLMTNMAPLPVEFLSFEARKIGDEVQLDWKVTDEQNVKGYHVQRSANSLNWQAIGFVDFKPSSAVINTYNLTDPSPLDGTSYYRIGEEDIDGKMSYSVIRTISVDINSMQVHLYPVPAKNVLNVNIQSTINATAMIKITDILGRTIRHSGIQLRTGGQTEEIPVSNMRPGMYFIEIQGSDYKWSGKFIKE